MSDAENPMAEEDVSSEDLDVDAQQEAPTIQDAVDMTALRDEVDSFLEAGEHHRAISALEEAADTPDTTRFLDENLWLYKNLANLCRAFDREDDAVAAYARAYELEPRDLEVLQPYAELLVTIGEIDEAADVMRSMLLHHKREIDEKTLGWIYRRLGANYEDNDALEKARHAFEKALIQRPSDQKALTGLLRVVGRVGEPNDVIEVRRRLIKSLDEPHARSMALVAMGDDWKDKFNDPWRALDTYEEALAEDPENKKALESIAGVAREIGDWRRLSRAYFTLSRLAEDEAEVAEWLIQSSFVAKEELWEPEKALSGFRRALEHDPTRLDAFKQVTSLLVDAKDWEGLEAAYLQLINANLELDNPDSRLLAVLWQKLGDLYVNHLEREEEALTAYDQASDFQPENVQLHDQTAQLAEDKPDYGEIALKHLNRIREIDASRIDTFDRIGRVLLRQKKVDPAFCHLRAFRAAGGQLDGKAKDFVDRLSRSMLEIPRRPMDMSLLKRFVVSNDVVAEISTVFRIIKPALEDWVGESRKKYGLGWRDTVKLKEQLAFNNIYKQIGDVLGFEELPELWRKPEQEGLINGAMQPPGMIVGDELLGSGRERHIAFVVGKQLTLFMEAFYLAAIRQKTDLQVFYLLAAQLVKPEFSFQQDDRTKDVYKRIKKSVKGDDERRLKKAIEASMTDNMQAQIDRWVEAVEDTANRVGFVFCDDLEVVRDYLNSEPQQISDRSVEDRMANLIEYSVSDRYLTLRQELGKTVG
ncbi:MAG: tetratricopeptide repeat protein [Myxococcota bacterium]